MSPTPPTTLLPKHTNQARGLARHCIDFLWSPRPIGPATLDGLRELGAGVTTVFLDASTPALVRRYGDTRRRHPLLGEVGSVEGAIEEERRRLGTVRA